MSVMFGCFARFRASFLTDAKSFNRFFTSGAYQATTSPLQVVVEAIQTKRTCPTECEIVAALSVAGYSSSKCPSKNTVQLADVCARELARRPVAKRLPVIAVAVWSLARLRVPEPLAVLLQGVEKASHLQVATKDASDLARFAWGIARLLPGCAEKGSCIQRVLDGVAKEAARRARRRDAALTAQGLSNISWALARTQIRDDDVFDSLGQRFVEIVEESVQPPSPQSIASVALAFASAQQANARLFDVISSEARRNIATYKPQEIANLAASHAKVRIDVPSFRQTLDDLAPEHLASFQSRDLAELAWAVGQLPGRNAACLTKVGGIASCRIGRFNPRDISTLAWGFADGRVSHDDLFTSISAKVVRGGLKGYSPQVLSTLLWAFARLSCRDDNLFREVVKTGLGNLNKFTPYDIANMMWAFARVSFQEIDVVVRLIAQWPQSKFDLFGAQSLSNLAWALATCRCVDCKGLFATIEKAALLNDMRTFEPQALSNLAWSFATVRLDGGDTTLLRAIASAAVEKGLADFSPQALSNIAWAFAKLRTEGQSARRLVEEIVAASACQLGSFSNQGLANLAWSCAMDVHTQEKLWKGIACRNKSADGTLLPAISKEFLRRIRKHNGSVAISTVNAGAFAVDTASVVWALHAAGLLHAEFVEEARVSLRCVGRSIDNPRRVQPSLLDGSKLHVATSVVVAGDVEADTPTVVMEMADAMVVLKPPGWEVDQFERSPQNALFDDSERRRLFSDYLNGVSVRNLLDGGKAFPIFEDIIHRRGILHRLDIPSSGLILAAKTYEAFYDLRIQLSAGMIVREYIVLCHGWIPPELTEIRERVDKVIGPGGGSLPGKVDKMGKPSLTNLKVIARLTRKPDGQRLSLAAIRIGTGRRHQIRVHMSFFGHPIVCDGKYTGTETFLSDMEWCPRNFLHRYRLAFEDTAGNLREITAKMPSDLTEVLSQLEANDGVSAEAVEAWLPGVNTPRDFSSWEIWRPK